MQIHKRIVWTLLIFSQVYSSTSYSLPLEKKIVSEVIDGDTIIFNSRERARLIGIDTPERNQPFYQEAKEYLKSVLANPNVLIDYDIDKRDRYGRLLIYLYLFDGTNVNDLILENGLAKIYFFPPNIAHRDEMISIQQEAISEKRGMWETEPEGDEEYYVGDPKTLLFHRPSDRIVNRIKKPIIFRTRFDAFRAGYGVHRPCHP